MPRSLRSMLAVLAILGIANTVAYAAATRGGPLGVPLPLFPADNWWNVDVSSAPVDARSSTFINFVGTGRTLHPDFGGIADAAANEIYGIPYIVVDGAQPKRTVQFDYSDESDGVNHDTDTSFPFYPIPDEAITQPYWIEGGPAGNQDVGGDRHILIVDRTNNHLYELFAVFHDGSTWRAGSGAFFDMNTNNRRPEGWTSADAAGLAILPGLVRYDEVYGTEPIRHAFRMTVRATNGYVYPASHRACSACPADALPLGARLRLKATKNISGYPAPIQRIFQAMKTYGLIVADNGSDMYISGTHDTRWDNGVLNPAFRSLTASDFEVVQLGWRSSGTPTPTPRPTATPVPTVVPTATPTPTSTPRPTATPTPTPTARPTATPTPTVRPTATPAPTATPTPTPRPTVPPTTVVRDFNGDGKADMIWRNSVTGANGIWFMDGTTFVNAAGLETVAPGEWDIAGSADFNADGKMDILWRNYKTGANAYWYMNGTERLGSAFIPSEPGTAWRIVGVADYNGDSTPDLYWQHTTGVIGVWLMNGTTRTGTALLPSSDGNWKVVGVADMDLNGSPDLVFRNIVTGANGLWFMTGTTRSSTAAITTVSDLRWAIQQVSDFNGDGRPDLFWRNTVGGSNGVWLMNGATVLGTQSVRSEPSTAWNAK